MQQIKFSCSSELEEWLEEKATIEERSLSQTIRILLYEAKRQEEAAVAS